MSLYHSSICNALNCFLFYGLKAEVLTGLNRWALCDLAPAFSLTSLPNTLPLASGSAILGSVSSVTPSRLLPQGLCVCCSLSFTFRYFVWFTPNSGLW